MYECSPVQVRACVCLTCLSFCFHSTTASLTVTFHATRHCLVLRGMEGAELRLTRPSVGGRVWVYAACTHTPSLFTDYCQFQLPATRVCGSTFYVKVSFIGYLGFTYTYCVFTQTTVLFDIFIAYLHILCPPSSSILLSPSLLCHLSVRQWSCSRAQEPAGQGRTPGHVEVLQCLSPGNTL